MTTLICAVMAPSAPVMHLPAVTVGGHLEFTAPVAVRVMNRCVQKGSIAGSGLCVADA